MWRLLDLQMRLKSRENQLTDDFIVFEPIRVRSEWLSLKRSWFRYPSFAWRLCDRVVNPVRGHLLVTCHPSLWITCQIKGKFIGTVGLDLCG